jgi:hypothetical protein
LCIINQLDRSFMPIKLARCVECSYQISADASTWHETINAYQQKSVLVESRECESAAVKSDEIINIFVYRDLNTKIFLTTINNKTIFEFSLIFFERKNLKTSCNCISGCVLVHAESRELERVLESRELREVWTLFNFLVTNFRRGKLLLLHINRGQYLTSQAEKFQPRNLCFPSCVYATPVNHFPLAWFDASNTNAWMVNP